jgi:hypothetical protein
MYHLINFHIENLLNGIKVERDVNPYAYLMQHFPNVNVTQDDDFQKVYRSYWTMNRARISDEFLRIYFALLERLKGTAEVSLRDVAKRFYAIPINEKGKQALLFSFSTKLVHMLRPHEPVYDSNVRAFFFLPEASAQRHFRSLTGCCFRISFCGASITASSKTTC